MRRFIHHLFIATVCGLLSQSCSINSAKKHYVTGERLWTNGDYKAALREFERAFELDSKGKIGLHALYRAAHTEHLFLNQYEQALKKFERILTLNPTPEDAWGAEKQIAEILFSRLENYPRAVGQYQKLLNLNPKAPEVPEFLYYQARARFFLKRFDEALGTYRKIVAEYSASEFAEKAFYQIGLTYYTRAESGSSGRELYQQSLDQYMAFTKKYPLSPLLIDAQFGIANCLEEMGQLAAAYQAYASLKDKYPAKQVIEIKMIRVQDRKNQIKRE